MNEQFLTAFIVLVGDEGVVITDSVQIDGENLNVTEFLPVAERPQTLVIEHAIFQLTEQLRARKVAEEITKLQLKMMKEAQSQSKIIVPR